jgi:hypothetical protein
MKTATSLRGLPFRQFLLPPKCITDRHGELRHKIPAVLLVQVGHVVEIKLRLEEHVSLDVNLHAKGAVHLEVIGGGHLLAKIRADRRGGAALLVEIQR